MPAIQDPNLGLNYGWSYGEDGWHTGMDANLKKLGALLHCSVKSASTGTPPGSPASGDRYIVPASGTTGAWVGKEKQLAVYVSAAWEYYAPSAGWRVWVEDTSAHLLYESGAWGYTTYPYDIGGAWNGLMTDGVVVARYPVPRALTLPTALTGSRGVLGVAPTSQADFDIQKNGGSVGTMRFAAAATTATFIMASDTAFAPGDVLSVVAPNPADATAADLGFSLAGIR